MHNISLNQIVESNNLVFIDTSILFKSLNFHIEFDIENFEKPQNSQKIAMKTPLSTQISHVNLQKLGFSNQSINKKSFLEIILMEEDYSEKLLDFVYSNSNVFITKKVYYEYMNGITLMKIKIGKMAFSQQASLNDRKKIAKIQTNYFNLQKTLNQKIFNKLDKNKSFFELLNSVEEQIKKIEYKKIISKTDVELYTHALFLATQNNQTAIITRDYDFLKINDSITHIEPYCKNKIYMQENNLNELIHKYKLLI